MSENKKIVKKKRVKRIVKKSINNKNVKNDNDKLNNKKSPKIVNSTKINPRLYKATESSKRHALTPRVDNKNINKGSQKEKILRRKIKKSSSDSIDDNKTKMIKKKKRIIYKKDRKQSLQPIEPTPDSLLSQTGPIALKSYNSKAKGSGMVMARAKHAFFAIPGQRFSTVFDNPIAQGLQPKHSYAKPKKGKKNGKHDLLRMRFGDDSMLQLSSKPTSLSVALGEKLNALRNNNDGKKMTLRERRLAKQRTMIKKPSNNEDENKITKTQSSDDTISGIMWGDDVMSDQEENNDISEESITRSRENLKALEGIITANRQRSETLDEVPNLTLRTLRQKMVNDLQWRSQSFLPPDLRAQSIDDIIPEEKQHITTSKSFDDSDTANIKPSESMLTMISELRINRMKMIHNRSMDDENTPNLRKMLKDSITRSSTSRPKINLTTTTQQESQSIDEEDKNDNEEENEKDVDNNNINDDNNEISNQQVNDEKIEKEVEKEKEKNSNDNNNINNEEEDLSNMESNLEET